MQMDYTQKYISDFFKNEDHKVLLWGPDDAVICKEEYQAMDFLSLFISLSGTIYISTDQKTWEAGSEDIQVFSFERSVKIESKTDDYRSIGILLSRRLWAERLLNAYPSLSLTLVRPVIRISPEKKEILLDFLNQLLVFKKEGRADDNPLFFNTLMGLMYHVGLICDQSYAENPVCHNCKIVADFSQLLMRHYKTERSVEFYAQKLCIGAPHLSAVIKQTTGVTVGNTIRKYIVMKICTELQMTDKTIKELSIEFNFKDESYFCKFFRNSLGISPEQYRKGRTRILF